VVGNRVILSIGDSADHLEKLVGPGGKGLLETPALAPVRAHMALDSNKDKPLTAISHLSQQMAAVLAPSADDIEQLAAMSDSGGYGPTRVAAGIVGYADLALGEAVEPVLEAHLRAGGGRFRGVRHSAAWDADPVIGNGHPTPGLLARPAFRAGLRRLTSLGLAFDLWVFHTQLAEALDVVRACPDSTFILGHCGGPLGYGPYAGKRDEVFAQWRAGMAALAGCPNVVVKLGGMMMRLAAYDYGALAMPPSSAELAEHWKPYILTCIELFGAERCLFESNFPVEKMGIGYGEIWNAFKRIADGASEGEKRALFAGTAKRVYRL
jgi:predicted TIM-barrel fold metal-dependent hydrolase